MLAGCQNKPAAHAGPATALAVPTHSPAASAAAADPMAVKPAAPAAAADPVARARPAAGAPARPVPPAAVSADGYTIIVSQAPPPPQAETPPARPSPGYIWIPGCWTWGGDRYEWSAGHWEIPPEGETTWVPPRWKPDADGYRFYEGYWK